MYVCVCASFELCVPVTVTAADLTRKDQEQGMPCSSPSCVARRNLSPSCFAYGCSQTALLAGHDSHQTTTTCAHWPLAPPAANAQPTPRSDHLARATTFSRTLTTHPPSPFCTVCVDGMSVKCGACLRVLFLHVYVSSVLELQDYFNLAQVLHCA